MVCSPKLLGEGSCEETEGTDAEEMAAVGGVVSKRVPRWGEAPQGV